MPGLLCLAMHIFLLRICQGVKAVIAESFDDSHRRALVGVGVLPLEFVNGQTTRSLKLSGREKFTVRLGGGLVAQQHVTVVVSITVHHCNWFYTSVLHLSHGFRCGLSWLHSAVEDAVSWLTSYGS